MSEARTEDRGSFTHAVCRACGWSGPGRRARASAERDLELHDLEGCPMEEAEYAVEGATLVGAAHPLTGDGLTGDGLTGDRLAGAGAVRVGPGHRPDEAEAEGGSQAHGIPVAAGEGGVAPGRERLTAHGRS